MTTNIQIPEPALAATFGMNPAAAPNRDERAGTDASSEFALRPWGGAGVWLPVRHPVHPPFGSIRPPDGDTGGLPLGSPSAESSDGRRVARRRFGG